jgi:hypothetical protein
MRQRARARLAGRTRGLASGKEGRMRVSTIDARGAESASRLAAALNGLCPEPRSC